MSLIGRGLIREGTGKRYRRMKIIFLFGFEGTHLENLLGTAGNVECSYSGLRSKTFFLDSSMVEHSAVNRVVVGSSPTRGAKRGTNPMLFKAPWSSG